MKVNVRIQMRIVDLKLIFCVLVLSTTLSQSALQEELQPALQAPRPLQAYQFYDIATRYCQRSPVDVAALMEQPVATWIELDNDFNTIDSALLATIPFSFETKRPLEEATRFALHLSNFMPLPQVEAMLHMVSNFVPTLSLDLQLWYVREIFYPTIVPLGQDKEVLSSFATMATIFLRGLDHCQNFPVFCKALTLLKNQALAHLDDYHAFKGHMEDASLSYTKATSSNLQNQTPESAYFFLMGYFSKPEKFLRFAPGNPIIKSFRYPPPAEDTETEPDDDEDTQPLEEGE